MLRRRRTPAHRQGEPVEVDAELWTTQLDRLVAYDPAEMLCVVEAGMRIATSRRLLAEGGQEWPVDAPSDATVGGVIAADVALPRQLRVGTLRDTVVEMEVVTGDGRLVRSGARTVKNVTGYDLHRLLTGSLGTLGVITQVALKVRPLPEGRPDARDRRRRARARPTAARGRAAAAAVLAAPDHVLVRLEGWPEEVAEQASALGGRHVVAATRRTWLAPRLFARGADRGARRRSPPSRLGALLEGVDQYRALDRRRARLGPVRERRGARGAPPARASSSAASRP